MAQKKKTDQKGIIAQKLLLRAGKSGWQSIRTRDLAGQFSSVEDLLQFIVAKAEKDTESTVKKYLSDSWRDNLLEILMTRFDIAQKNRAAFIDLPGFLKRNPSSAMKMLQPFHATMERMLTLAKFPKKCRQAAAVLFGILYLSLIDVWKHDDTPDLSKTMAAADKRLGLFERLMSF